MGNNGLGNFQSSGNSSGFGTQPGAGSPDGLKGGDVHDTFKVDNSGNVSEGHTSVNLGGGVNTSVPWNSGK